MSRTLTAKDLFGMMHSLYPGIEDGRDDHDTFEHPLTAVGVVLLSAALLETIDPSFLRAFTNYGCRPGMIYKARLWDHVGIATGTQWVPTANTKAACCTGMRVSRLARGHGNASVERVCRLTAIQERVVSLTPHKTDLIFL
jgi:hypothetical protein